MNRMRFSDEELAILRELVDLRLDELGPEIHHTRTPDYHEDLKQYRDALKRLRERLAGAPSAAAR
ncbi:MAG: hypothetical protein CHACPFDD_03968 [Phycisphaerae bacterium]|nr:hypothetical protein [Phycisphaerae bacterium]